MEGDLRMNYIDVSLKAYKDSQKEFHDKYVEYEKLCKEAGKSTVVLSDISNAFIAMREMISWAVSLYDRIDRENMTKDEISFMSGIKYINNILKHEKTNFNPNDVLGPGMLISAQVDDKKDGPIIQDVSIEARLVWGDLQNIPEKSKYMSQRDNYFQYIQKHGILEIMDKLDKIIYKYYQKDLS